MKQWGGGEIYISKGSSKAVSISRLSCVLGAHKIHHPPKRARGIKSDVPSKAGPEASPTQYGDADLRKKVGPATRV